MFDHEGDEDRATVVAVRVGSRSGPGWIVAATAVVVAVVTFAFGYRLGNAPPAPPPTAISSLVPTTPPADPTASPSPGPDIVTEAVSRRLRGAVSAAGGPVVGAWVVCQVGEVIACRPIEHVSLDDDYAAVAFRFSTEQWDRLVPETVASGDIVVAAPLNAVSAGAVVALLSPAFDPLASHQPVGVNADQQGVYFFDLGSLDPGQYVVAVGGLTQGAGVNGAPDYTYASFYAGLDVVMLPLH
ncbi:MAG: hypothetical protein ACRDF7_02420 [Candidatus Limnocylindrales bacterium]